MYMEKWINSDITVAFIRSGNNDVKGRYVTKIPGVYPGIFVE